MHYVIQAEGGDLITVDHGQLGLEQELVHVQLDNPVFQEGEIDGFSLSVRQARELARALLAASRFIESLPSVEDELRQLEHGLVRNAPSGGYEPSASLS